MYNISLKFLISTLLANCAFFGLAEAAMPVSEDVCDEADVRCEYYPDGRVKRVIEQRADFDGTVFRLPTQDILNDAQIETYFLDVNADGLKDLIVSSLGYDVADRDKAKLYVIFWRPDMPATIHVDNVNYNGTYGFIVEGIRSSYNPTSSFGFRLELGNDYDTDGHRDISITTTNTAGHERGAATVIYSGQNFHAVLDIRSLSHEQGFNLDASLNDTGISTPTGIFSEYNFYYVDSSDFNAYYVIYVEPGYKLPSDWNPQTLYVERGLKINRHPDPSLYTHAAYEGDFNADNAVDMAIQTYFNAATGDSDIRDYILFGRPEGLRGTIDIPSLVMDGVNGFEIKGMKGVRFSHFTRGDINGDGFSDYGIMTSKAERNSFEALYVIYGHAGAFDPAVDVNNLNGQNGFVLSAPSWTYGFREIFQGIADLNNDGRVDMFFRKAGQFFFDDLKEDLYVVFGSANFDGEMDISELGGGEVMRIRAYPRVSGHMADTYFFTKSDMSGDGFPEYVARVTNYDVLNPHKFRLYVIFGAAVMPSEIDLQNPGLNGANGFVVEGFSTLGYGGHDTSSGDFNGDGIQDLMIRTYKDNTSVQNGSGDSFVIYGSSDGFPPVIDLTSLSAEIGYRIHNSNPNELQIAGDPNESDVTGDGVSDQVLKYTDNAGDISAVYVAYGNSETPEILDPNLLGQRTIKEYYQSGNLKSLLSPEGDSTLYYDDETQTEVLRGDLNHDRVLDRGDLAEFAGQLGGSDAQADLNSDGKVGLRDLLILRDLIAQNGVPPQAPPAPPIVEIASQFNSPEYQSYLEVKNELNNQAIRAFDPVPADAQECKGDQIF